jgi:hypothetical protein
MNNNTRDLIYEYSNTRVQMELQEHKQTIIK